MSGQRQKYEFIKIRACRLCLDIESENNLLLHDTHQWFELLEYCIGLKIKHLDNPQTVCSLCAKKIWDFMEFKKQCLRSHSIWKTVTSDSMICLVDKIIMKSENELKSYNLEQNVSNNIDIYNNICKFENKCDERLNTESENIFDNEQCDRNILIKGTVNDFDSDIDVKEDSKLVNFLPVKNINIEFKKPAKVSNGVEEEIGDELNSVKCKKTLATSASLKNHVKICGLSKEGREKNKIQQTFLCGICRFTSYTLEEVNRHLEDHMESNDLECKLCNFIGIDFAQMLSHRIYHSTSKYTVQNYCPYCKKVTLNKYAMEYHYRSSHLQKAGGFCRECKLQFSNYNTFRHHILVHSEDKYVCDICNATFLRRKKMIQHLKHHPVKKFICHECGKDFKRSNNLMAHMKTVHVKEDPIKCNHCNKYFKSTLNLREHMKLFLDKKSSLKCDICGKCYSTPHGLKIHQIWHNEDRPYSCDTCGARYKVKQQLKVHYLRIHMGLRPFKCDSCTKCFYSAVELRRHSGTHTGLRAYKCLHCDRSFNQKARLLRHRVSVHKSLDIADKDNISAAIDK